MKMLSQEPVTQAIHNALNHYSYGNAIFLAERLYHEVKTDESIHLLATCYFRSGNVIKAYHYLKAKTTRSVQCRYLLAVCCMVLKKHAEAEVALCTKFSNGELQFKADIEDLIHEFGYSACYALALMGDIKAKCDDTEGASQFYKRSLVINQLMWQSFTGLCNIGEFCDPADVFQSSANELNSKNTPFLSDKLQSVDDVGSPDIYGTIIPPCPGDSGAFSNLMAKAKTTMIRSVFADGLSNLSPMTPSIGLLPLNSPVDKVVSNLSFDSPPIAEPLRHIKKPNSRPLGQSGNNVGQIANQKPTLRRSQRLFGFCNTLKENSAKQKMNRNSKLSGVRVSNNIVGGITDNRKGKTKSLRTDHGDEMKMLKSNDQNSKSVEQNKFERTSLDGLLGLYQKFGAAYQSMCQFNLSHALEYLKTFPKQHYFTSWVLAAVGRCYFERADYLNCSKTFDLMRKLEPYCVDGLDIFSTALFHLEREVELSGLSSFMLEFDKTIPETWCCLGNLYGVERDHETAIKFLKRAVQVAPDVPYAYSLLGHEYRLKDELDKALQCFRSAVSVDARHYRGWYGIGLIYHKQEKYKEALNYFTLALKINPRNPVLLCHLATVQYELGMSNIALETLDATIAAHPNHCLSKFRKASILFTLERHSQALIVLKKLSELVPKESMVYFLIGKIYKKQGRNNLALKNFNHAIELDPKGANNQMKEELDKRYLTDEDITTPGPSQGSILEQHVRNSQDYSSDDDGGLTSDSLDTEGMQLQADESDESL